MPTPTRSRIRLRGRPARCAAVLAALLVLPSPPPAGGGAAEAGPRGAGETEGPGSPRHGYERVSTWGGDGSDPGRLHYPGKLTVSGDHVWIADAHNGRLQKMTLDGELLEVVGSAGTWYGQLADAMDVAVGPRGDLHAADAGNFRVQWLRSDGTYLAQWRLDRPEEKTFQAPQGIAAGPDGDLYVTDPANHRVHRLRLQVAEPSDSE